VKVLEIAKALERQGNEVVISAEPCYGACDLKISEARGLGCDKIVHYGHTKFLNADFPVEYVECKEKVNVIPILEKNYEKIKDFKTIGLISSLQFVDAIADAKKNLEEKGHSVFVGKSSNGEKKLYPGQVLGCDISAALAVEEKVDCFLFIGSGKFHPLGLSLKSRKPIFSLDFEKGKIENMDHSIFLKQKLAAIEIAKEAKIFGILVSTKPGQQNIGLAEEIKKKIEKTGRTAFVLALDEIKPEKLIGIKVDCWVNTACPRIAIENRTQFKEPVLNPSELEEIL